MAQIIQLNMWDNSCIETMPDPTDDVENIFFGQEWKYVCQRCDFAGLCDRDECAWKNYDIDVNEPMEFIQGFKDWLSDIY